jgi:hypothetical protein
MSPKKLCALYASLRYGQEFLAEERFAKTAHAKAYDIS